MVFMSNKKRAKQAPLDEIPTLDVPIIEIGELEQQLEQQLEQRSDIVWSPGESLPRYVVVRGGLRVSDKDYPKPDEPRAIAERDFWQKVVNRYPDGTKIEIVQYDKKKHRIW